MFESRGGTAGGANSAWAGRTVYDANREKVGTISAYNAQAGYFIAQKGVLFPHDLYIPVGAIARSDASNVYLNLSNDQLRDERYKSPVAASGTAAAGTAAAGAMGTAKADLKSVTGDGPAVRANDRVDLNQPDVPRADVPRADVNRADMTGRDMTGRDMTGRETTRALPMGQDIEDIAVPLREETLTANRTREQIGNVHVHRYVVQEDQTIEAPVTHEEVVIEHLTTPNLPIGTDTFTERDVDMPLMGERLALGTDTHVAEEVHIHKRLVTDHQHASGTVRREQIRVEGDAQDLARRDTLPKDRDALPRDRDSIPRDGDPLTRS